MASSVSIRSYAWGSSGKCSLGELSQLHAVAQGKSRENAGLAVHKALSLLRTLVHDQ